VCRRLLDQDNLYNIGNALKLLQELFGDRPASEFDGLQFESFRSALIKRKYSRDYGNRILGIIRGCFKWALKFRHIEADQYARICTVELFDLQRGRDNGGFACERR
jgi:hypothetical protein